MNSHTSATILTNTHTNGEHSLTIGHEVSDGDSVIQGTQKNAIHQIECEMCLLIRNQHMHLCSRQIIMLLNTFSWRFTPFNATRKVEAKERVGVTEPPPLSYDNWIKVVEIQRNHFLIDHNFIKCFILHLLRQLFKL